MTWSKYGNRKIEIDGYVFDSVREGRRYSELKILEASGEISNLELQPEFPCVVNGKKICKYRADFRYISNGDTVVEDSKGFRTTIYKLKKRLVEALYDVVIVEV
jgi:hypothetical protein